MTVPPSSGLHHVTAIAGEPQRLVDFYAGTLGLRLVKRTINFDDPGTYHFYFGDATGAPGSLITFFPWAGARRGRVGAGQVTETAFGVPAGSLDAWARQLETSGVAVGSRSDRFGAHVLTLEDPDGLRLALVEGTGTGTAITGIVGATMTVRAPEQTGAMLAAMGFRHLGAEGHRTRYVATDPSRPTTDGTHVDLVHDVDAPAGHGGVGTVHHIAWRTSDADSQLLWHRALQQAGASVSPVMDRCYFQSIYFREPSGVLFEIATDGPGFATDEPVKSLGQSLQLPAWLEAERQAIEAVLPPIQVPAWRGAETGADQLPVPAATEGQP